MARVEAARYTCIILGAETLGISSGCYQMAGFRVTSVETLVSTIRVS
jgi:hypothetical protein